MLSKILDGKMYVYDLVLCKTNKEPICFIPCCNFQFTGKFHDYNSISFDVNKYIINAIGKYINPAWKILDQALLIHLYTRQYDPTASFSSQVIYEEFFYSTAPQYNSDNETKSITADSWHKIQFENIKVRGYDDTRKLYDYTGTTAYTPVSYNFNNMYEGGILNYIQEYKLPNWSIDYDYKYLQTQYTDSEKKSITEVKTTIDQYISSSEVESTREKIARWSIYANNLGNLYGYNMVGGEIVYSPTGAAITDTASAGYVNAIMQAYDFFQNKFYLSTSELGSSLSGNSLANQTFGKDWLTSETMTGDNLYNVNLLKTIYSTMFNKIILNVSNALTAITDTNSMISSKTDEGEIYLNDSNNSITIQEFFDLLLDIYSDTIKVYTSITSLAVGTTETFRSLTFDSDTLASVFTQLEDAYVCFFDFDNVNNIIHVYSRNNPILQQDSGMIVSPHNIVSTYQYTSSLDKIVTRLYFSGKDNTVISGVNPTGERYVDNFEPFLNSDIYMSEDLKGFLQYYQNKLDEYLSDYTVTNVTSHKKNIKSLLFTYYNESLALLRIALSYFTSFYRFANDTEVVSSEDYEYKILVFKNYTISKFKELYDYLVECNTEFQEATGGALFDVVSIAQDNFEKYFADYLDDIQNGYLTNNIAQFIKVANFFGADISSDITSSTFKDFIENGAYSIYETYSNGALIPSIRDMMQKIADSFNYRTACKSYLESVNVTATDAKINEIICELNNFIFEDDISVDYITNADVGLYYTIQYFNYLHTIPFEIPLTLVDILSSNTYKTDKLSLFNLGVYITVHNPETDEYTKVRLLSYTHSPDSNDLTMTLGNTEELTDSLNVVTKNVFQYTMKVAEKSNDYIKKYDSIVREMASILGIDLPDNVLTTNDYTSGQSIYDAVGGITLGEKKVTPTTSSGSSTTDTNTSLTTPISSVANNAIKRFSDGLWSTDYNERISALENNNAQCLVKQMLDGIKLTYISKTDNVERGVYIKDDDIYQMRGDSLVKLYPIAIVNDVSEIDKLPTGTLAFVGTIGG